MTFSCTKYIMLSSLLSLLLISYLQFLRSFEVFKHLFPLLVQCNWVQCHFLTMSYYIFKLWCTIIFKAKGFFKEYQNIHIVYTKWGSLSRNNVPCSGENRLAGNWSSRNCQSNFGKFCYIRELFLLNTPPGQRTVICTNAWLSSEGLDFIM